MGGEVGFPKKRAREAHKVSLFSRREKSYFSFTTHRVCACVCVAVVVAVTMGWKLRRRRRSISHNCVVGKFDRSRLKHAHKKIDHNCFVFSV